MSHPSSEIFFRKKLTPITEQELNEIQMKRKTELLFVKFLPPKGVDDVVWPQMRKFAERLQGILEESQYEFKVLGKDVFTDGSYIASVLLEMEVSKLPDVQKRIGPSVFDKDDAKRFLEKYKDAIAGPYIEGNNWVVETTRQFKTAREKIVDSLTKSLDELLAKGVPKQVAERIANGFDVFSETERIVEESRRNPEFGIFIRKYFEKEKLV
jgi:tRNA nucleotidyltransferase (CCA-adding enzyme)